MSTCSGHTQTYCPYTSEAWIITRIYWMVLVVLHSIRSVFIGAPDRWGCLDGWRCRSRGGRGATTFWIKLKPRNEHEHQASRGCHLVWWTPRSCRGGDEWLSGFLLKAMNKSGRAKAWEREREKQRWSLEAHRKTLPDKTPDEFSEIGGKLENYQIQLVSELDLGTAASSTCPDLLKTTVREILRKS